MLAHGFALREYLPTCRARAGLCRSLGHCVGAEWSLAGVRRARSMSSFCMQALTHDNTRTSLFSGISRR